jgi:hypothetical protein
VRQVNDAGLRAAAALAPAAGQASPVHFWEYDWQSDEMTRRKYEVGPGAVAHIAKRSLPHCLLTLYQCSRARSEPLERGRAW